MLLRRISLMVFIFVLARPVFAQKNQPQNQSAGASGLTGETHQLRDWPTALPAAIKDARVVSYKVIQVQGSTSQPLILERDCMADATRCLPTRRHPLRDGQKLVIEIIDSDGLLTLNSIKLLNFNIVSQAASTITPDQVRPSLSTSGGGGSGQGGPAPAGLATPVATPRIYYMVWPVRLTGDTVPTVTINAIMNITTHVSTLTVPPAPNSTGNTQTVDTTSEQILNLLNVQYPQVHSLYSFNVSVGMIYSTLRNPSWTRVESVAPVTCAPNSTGCTPSPEMYQTVLTPGSRQIDPALFFTPYVFGKFDAEMKEHWSDLKPEPTVGLSLSSPSTDFFFGATSEVWRGVQIVGGVHEGKINYLVPPLVSDPASSTAPTTTQKFHHGYFVGVTFNINFIQGLFGGGKGGGS